MIESSTTIDGDGEDVDAPLPDKARQVRLERARRFLDEILFPFVKEKGFLTQGEIDMLVQDFRDRYPDAGDAILGRVWLEAKRRDLVNDCLSSKTPDLEVADAALIKRILGLLSDLNEAVEEGLVIQR